MPLVVIVVVAISGGSAWFASTVDGRGFTEPDRRVAQEQPARVAYSSDDGLVIATLGSNGRPETSSVVYEGVAVSPTLSPDGTSVAFVVARGNNSDIYVIDIDGSNRRAVTATGELDETGPAWSPDGSRLAFERTGDDGKAQIVIRSLIDAGEVQITANDYVNAGPAWSPDGQRLVYFRNPGEQSDLYSYDLQSRETRRLTNTRELSESLPAVSQDSRIAYLVVADDNVPSDATYEERFAAISGGRSIEILEPDGSVTRAAPTGDVFNPEWVDVDTLAYANFDKPTARIMTTDLNGSSETAVLSGIAFLVFAWSGQ